MNKLQPDRKEFKKELEEGIGAGVWFCIIFVLFMILIFILIDKCTHNPLKDKKQVADTTEIIDTMKITTIVEKHTKKQRDSLSSFRNYTIIPNMKERTSIYIETLNKTIVGSLDSVIEIYCDSIGIWYLIIPDDKDIITWNLNDSIQRADLLQRLKYIEKKSDKSGMISETLTEVEL